MQIINIVWSRSLPLCEIIRLGKTHCLLLQAQQFADAGINSAITGQGISSSSIPNTGVSTNPASLSSTNPGEFISSAASFILNATSGLSSVVNSFGNLNLSKKRLQFDKDNALIDFHKYARENGFTLNGNKLQRGYHNGIGYSFDDVVSGNTYTP